MKGRKKLLAIIPALGLFLSGCSFAEIKHSIGESWVGEHILHPVYDPVRDLINGGDKKQEEKKDEEKKEECQHQDANHDGTCDLCGETGLEVKHTDENGDHKCDVCGAVISEHKDENNDHKCDLCGETISEHKDENNDHKCDLCGETISEHVDDNHDHVCDICGQQSDHLDENHDHVCDLCGETISEHKDEDVDGKCDICDASLEVAFELDLEGVTRLFSQDEQFTSEGLKVLAKSAGSSKELEFSVEEPSFATIGEKDVVVSFSFGGEEKSLSYTVEVVGWSEDDLKLFDHVSLSSNAPLPFLKGHNMRTERELDEDGYLVDWSIVADEVDDAAFLEYFYMLQDYNKVVLEDDTEVTFKLIEYPYEDMEYLETYYGLSDVSVFLLMPTYWDSEEEVDEETGEVTVYEYETRAFFSDEYLVLGRNEDGQLVMKNRLVDASLDALIAQTEFLDGDRENGYHSWVMKYFEGYIRVLMNYMYSELSPSALILPQITTQDGFLSVANYFSVDPFNFDLDEYAFALNFYFEDVTEEEFNTFIESLAAKYDYDEESKVYSFEDELFGYFAIIDPTFEVKEYTGGTYTAFEFDFAYVAPEQYTNHLSYFGRTLANLIIGYQVLDVADYEIDDYYYKEDGDSDLHLYVNEVQLTEEQVAAGLTSHGVIQSNLDAFLQQALGFTLNGDPEISETLVDIEIDDEGNWNFITAEVITASYTLEGKFDLNVIVFEAEEGINEVVIEIYDYVAPLTTEDVLKIVFGENEVSIDEESGAYYTMIYDESATVDGAESMATEIMDALEEAKASVDGGVYISDSELLIGGTFADESMSFTVIIAAYEEAGYIIQAEIAEITELESWVRKLCSFVCFGDCLKGYDYFDDGEGGFVIDFICSGYEANAEGFASAVENEVLTAGQLEDFEQVGEATSSDEGYEVTLSDGKYEITLVATPYVDGEDTYIEILTYVSEVEQPEDPVDPEPEVEPSEQE